MIRNPIIHREVLSTLRTKRAIILQSLFFLVLMGLLRLLWPADGLQDLGGRGSQRIFSILAIGELLMVILCAPAFTAVAITREKERNTWEGLFATRLNPWEIALGKIVGALGFLLLLVLSGVTALCMPFLLGGVSGLHVVAVIGILLLTAIYLGMIGLLISSLFRRSYRAIVATYLVLLGVCFVLASPAWPISQHLITRVGPEMQTILHTLASLSPIQAMVSLVFPQSPYAVGAQHMPPFWAMFLMLSPVAIALLAACCFYKLRHPVAPRRTSKKRALVERGPVTARTFFFVIDPRKRRKPIAWWKNPILCKEFRTRPMLQVHWLVRTIVGCLITSVLLMLLVGVSVGAFVSTSANAIPTMLTAIGALMVVLIVMVGPAMSGGAICADRESGAWDLLRTTPIPSWRIVSGKFLASIIPLILLAVAVFPAMGILLYFDPHLWPHMVHVGYVVGMTILFVSTAGTFFSSLFSRTSLATAWTYALVITLALLTLLAMLADDLFSPRLLRWILVVNPVVASMEATGHAAMQRLGLLHTHLALIGTATGALFLFTIARVFQLRRPEK